MKEERDWEIDTDVSVTQAISGSGTKDDPFSVPMREPSGRARSERTNPVKARFEGRCSHCDGLIAPGDEIEKSLGGWMHKDCPADPPDDDQVWPDCHGDL